MSELTIPKLLPPNLRYPVNKYSLRVQAFFRNQYDEPFLLTAGQCDIFKAIYEPSILRAAITTVTQYGKSEVASMAAIMACCERREKVLIVAPSSKQAGIIMSNIIKHLFDHPYITAKIEYSGRLEQLRNERSKTRITFLNGSEIMILTADAETVSKEARNLMGFGATIVLVDESALIPDEMFSKIFRMIGGQVRDGVQIGKIVEMSNPFEKNHFHKSLHNPNYFTVRVDYVQAIAEGRLSPEFLQEAKDGAVTPLDWVIFYLVEFPEAGADNAVIPLDWIEKAVNQKGREDEVHQRGLDVARYGKDSTVLADRRGGLLLPLLTCDHLKTTEVVGWARPELDKDMDAYTNVDAIGIGAGVFDRLDELGYPVREIVVGEAPTEPNKDIYYNLRSEIYWNLREWFQPDKAGNSRISIPDDPELKKELAEVRYTYSSDRKIKVEPKEDIKKRLKRSPDKADAVTLAFFTPPDDEPEMVIM